MHLPEEAAAPSWPSAAGSPGRGHGFATTPINSTNVLGKSPFSLLLSLTPGNQPGGLRSPPSGGSADMSEALATVSRSPGWRLMSLVCSRLYSKRALYWKVSDPMATGVHRKVSFGGIPELKWTERKAVMLTQQR